MPSSNYVARVIRGSNYPDSLPEVQGWHFCSILRSMLKPDRDLNLPYLVSLCHVLLSIFFQNFARNKEKVKFLLNFLIVKYNTIVTNLLLFYQRFNIFL